MTVKVTARGAERWKQGHPWIYRSDVAEESDKKPGIVSVTDRKGKFLGKALYSPSSEIRVRLLTRYVRVDRGDETRFTELAQDYATEAGFGERR